MFFGSNEVAMAVYVHPLKARDYMDMTTMTIMTTVSRGSNH